uniref:Putative secreted peptide n=1 Tax=Anopheles braziliensis TaxID=58242 RepID=A0A2M3ZQQ5_9DIPT
MAGVVVVVVVAVTTVAADGDGVAAAVAAGSYCNAVNFVAAARTIDDEMKEVGDGNGIVAAAAADDVDLRVSL